MKNRWAEIEHIPFLKIYRVYYYKRKKPQLDLFELKGEGLIGYQDFEDKEHAHQSGDLWILKGRNLKSRG